MTKRAPTRQIRCLTAPSFCVGAVFDRKLLGHKIEKHENCKVFQLPSWVAGHGEHRKLLKNDTLGKINVLLKHYKLAIRLLYQCACAYTHTCLHATSRQCRAVSRAAPAQPCRRVGPGPDPRPSTLCASNHSMKQPAKKPKSS